LSKSLWVFKCLKFLIQLYIYILIVSGFFPLAVIFLNRRNCTKSLHVSFILWLASRFTSDVTAHFFYEYIGISVFPVFHISILVESLLIIWYFFHISKSLNGYLKIIYLIPIAIFLLETQVFGSIFTTNRFGLMSYYTIVSALMLTLLFSNNRIEQIDLTIIRVLFVFHAVSFVHSIFEHLLRTNQETMALIYPFVLLLIVSINFFFTKYLWSVLKN
jgi:hypothetical protein